MRITKIQIIKFKEKASFNTKSVSPVIRQALQQWAYQITFENLETEKWNK